jgi:hypothetical protein
MDFWEDLPQIRWKPHPGGWTAVVVGAPLPGPAGVLHNPPPGGAVACCLPGGGCLMVAAVICDAVGGTAQPEGVVCLGDGNGNSIDDTCEAPRACCLPDGGCVSVSPAACVSLNGVSQPPGVV